MSTREISYDLATHTITPQITTGESTTLKWQISLTSGLLPIESEHFQNINIQTTRKIPPVYLFLRRMQLNYAPKTELSCQYQH